MHNIHGSQRTAAIHTNRITSEAGILEEDGWILHFSWVKAHNNRENELDQLGKEAACDNLQIAYHKYPKSEVSSELKCLGLQKWQSEWDNTNKGALTKTFNPSVKDRLLIYI
jgi:hypothetical protein